MAGYLSSQVITEVLSPLANSTDLFSSEKYASVTSIKPVIKCIHSDILAEKNGDASLVKDIKRHICTHLHSRYLDIKIKTLLDITLFFDPRSKTEHVVEENRIATKENVIGKV